MAHDAELLRQQSEELFRAAFEWAAIGMALVAPDGRWLRVNHSACRLLGYEASELMRKIDCLHIDDSEADREADRCLVAEILAGVRTHYEQEKRYRHRAGHAIWVLESVSAVRDDSGEPRYFLLQMQDISSRKDLEHRLRESEARLRAITDNITMAVSLYDRERRVQFANRAALRILGRPDDPAAGQRIEDWVPPQLAALSVDARRRAFEGETVKFTATHPVEGVERRWEVTYIPELEQGAVKNLYAFAYDITEREALVAEVRQAKADLEAILDNVPAMISYWHNDGANRFANRAYLEAFSRPGQVMRGDPDQSVLDEEAYETSRLHFEPVRAGRSQTFERRTRLADGSIRHQQVHYVPDLQDGEVAGMYVLATDITELHDSRERIRELAQRLESAREDEREALALKLHEGLAQDLFVAKMSVEHMKRLARGNAALRESCGELIHSLDQIMEAVRVISNELRPGVLTHLGLAEAINRHLKVVAERAGLSVQVSAAPNFPRLAPELGTLLYRVAQESLRNIIRHARARRVAIELAMNGREIVMRITDDGIGITEKDRRKMGSLGLLGIEERLRAHHGRLDLARAAPRGTRLTASVPVDPLLLEPLAVTPDGLVLPRY